MYDKASEELRKRYKADEINELDIAEVLRTWAMKENKTLSGIAQETGLPKQTVYNLLHGKTQFKGINTLYAVTRALGRTLKEVIGRAEGDLPRSVFKGSKEMIFEMDFRNLGFTLVSDIPPTKHFFIGQLVLDPGCDMKRLYNLQFDCYIFIKVIEGEVEVNYEGKMYRLGVGDKLLINGRLKHNFRNCKQVKKAICTFITAPAFWTSDIPA